MLPLSLQTPPEIQSRLGKRFQELRLLRNIRRVSLAHTSSVSVESIKRFETQGEVSLSNLVRLALALDCIDEFEALFSRRDPQSIDEILKKQEAYRSKRRRASA